MTTNGGILIAPTEPDLLKALGVSSSVPEKAGVDIMWPAFGGLVGVQRKEIGDLFSSIGNGRLNTELAKARTRLKVTWLLVEGSPFWGRDGRLSGRLGSFHSRWTRDGYWAFLSGIQASGVWVAFTDDLGQTVSWVERTCAWSWKEKHTSMMQRPNPRGRWGRADSKEWMVHLLSSFEGVSVGKALAILDVFPAPLMWTVSEEELRSVKGIGPTLAKRLTEALRPPGGLTEPNGHREDSARAKGADQ